MKQAILLIIKVLFFAPLLAQNNSDDVFQFANANSKP
jgi:hypothetical protein